MHFDGYDGARFVCEFLLEVHARGGDELVDATMGAGWFTPREDDRCFGYAAACAELAGRGLRALCLYPGWVDGGLRFRIDRPPPFR